ncbi:hypothetical protein [Mariniplasma anaerobium]|uniref:Uncharacterized protein n=1 Tax=Mariniplasma anaerobium TaxID=2735436 RepID=A0A7U9TH08_9MOLU|nr:hypothetical protein [Mariniplasma anaerobium]BCR35847.1 hypothetical protein MPAN_007400 [Mariniplasma anaerobium]
MLTYRKKFDAINDNWDNTQSRLVIEDENLIDSLKQEEVSRQFMSENTSLLDSIMLFIVIGIAIIAIIL